MSYALELRDLRKSFGKTEIIRGANLAVAPGERVAIIGPNGAGKTTLFNLISGRFPRQQWRHPAQRAQHRRPAPVRDQPPRAGAQLPGVEPLHPAVGVREPALRWACRSATATRSGSSRQPGPTPTTAPKLMAMIKLDRRPSDTLAMNLTYAEQRALEIGITIAGGADVVLLHEPTAGMSKRADGALRRTLIPRSHDRQDAAHRRSTTWASCSGWRQDRGARLARSSPSTCRTPCAPTRASGGRGVGARRAPGGRGGTLPTPRLQRPPLQGRLALGHSDSRAAMASAATGPGTGNAGSAAAALRASADRVLCRATRGGV